MTLEGLQLPQREAPGEGLTQDLSPRQVSAVCDLPRAAAGLGREAAHPGACLVCPPQFVGGAKYPTLSRLGGSREAMEKEQAQTSAGSKTSAGCRKVPKGGKWAKPRMLG